MLKLFLTFLKINFMSPSGPASIGLTQKLVVPDLVTNDQFTQIISIATGIPGSDAIQIAWQVGYASNGILGALIATIAALIPTILLVSLVLMGLKFISIDVLQAFFKGVTPAMAVFLALTAFNLLPHTFSVFVIGIICLTTIMLLLKVPIVLILIACGLLGVFIK